MKKYHKSVKVLHDLESDQELLEKIRKNRKDVNDEIDYDEIIPMTIVISLFIITGAVLQLWQMF